MSDDGDTSSGGRGTRAYHSPRRQEQARRTRQRILAAAGREFLASGYAGTTMRSIAAAAEVSVPTVELAFGTKSELFKQVIDVAIAGDDEPVPVLGRPWVADAEAATAVGDFLDICSGVLAAGQQRSARLIVVAVEAAAADPAVRVLVEQRLAQRSRTAEWVADGIIDRAPLRPGIVRAHAVDTLWLLMDPVVFCRLTEDRGWSPDRYRRWFADSAQRLLVASA